MLYNLGLKKNVPGAVIVKVIRGKSLNTRTKPRFFFVYEKRERKKETGLGDGKNCGHFSIK